MNLFQHDKHVKLWDWLSQNPLHMKEDWPGWKEEKYTIYNRCYACDFARREQDGNTAHICSFCPLQWENQTCSYDFSAIKEKKKPSDFLFTKWFTEQDAREKVRLARKIRDLPTYEWVKVSEPILREPEEELLVKFYRLSFSTLSSVLTYQPGDGRLCHFLLRNDSVAENISYQPILFFDSFTVHRMIEQSEAFFLGCPLNNGRLIDDVRMMLGVDLLGLIRDPNFSEMSALRYRVQKEVAFIQQVSPLGAFQTYLNLLSERFPQVVNTIRSTEF